MPAPEVLRALLAGLIAGAAAAFALTAIALGSIGRSERWGQRPPSTALPLPLLGVVVVNGAMLLFTGLGLVLGAGFHRLESHRPADGLASPNLLFTAVVAGSVLALLGLAAFVRGRLTWPMWSAALACGACFGWLLPWLAVQGH